MTIVVTEVIISSKSPQYLQPITDEMKKASCYAFENEETFERFTDGVRRSIEKLNSRQDRRLNVEMLEISSAIQLSITNSSDVPLVFMKLVRLKGHVHVSKNGQKLYPQDFIKEDIPFDNTSKA